jgi:hypothetical protein
MRKQIFMLNVNYDSKKKKLLVISETNRYVGTVCGLYGKMMMIPQNS